MSLPADPGAATAPAAAARRTPAQIEAARRNGARSRGPVTEAGLARARTAGLRHGLRAARAYGQAPWRAVFEAELDELRVCALPRDGLEARLLVVMADASLRMMRARQLEDETLAHAARRRDGVADRDMGPALATVLRYRASATADYLKAQRELERLQARPLEELATDPADLAEASRPQAAAAMPRVHEGPETALPVPPVPPHDRPGASTPPPAPPARTLSVHDRPEPPPAAAPASPEPPPATPAAGAAPAWLASLPLTVQEQFRRYPDDQKADFLERTARVYGLAPPAGQAQKPPSAAGAQVASAGTAQTAASVTSWQATKGSTPRAM